jgi:hypothetical protein
MRLGKLFPLSVVSTAICLLLVCGLAALTFPKAIYAEWLSYGERYAIIVMGGNVSGPPHYQWYWNDTSSMYLELISYGFTGENIYFFSYGDSANAHPDWVDAVSTTENIRTGYEWAEAQCTASDLLYIYWVDHGSPTYFNTYYGTINHAELGTLMDSIVSKQIIGGYNPCYSGAVIDDISREGVITATSQDAYHPNSWGWAGNWRRALRGDPADSIDTNLDGHISLTEAYNWIAPRSQAAGEHSMFDDNGDGVGHEWNHPGYDPCDSLQDGYNGNFYSLDGWWCQPSAVSWQNLALTEFALHPAYPNPFNPVTTISYGVPVRGVVRVDVYNVLGRKTAELVHAIKSAGHHSISWNAGELPSGIYFVRISARTPSGEAGEFHQTRKVVLLK